jgi:hypothetical protein
MGVRIAVDDFGTGCALCLKRLPSTFSRSTARSAEPDDRQRNRAIVG